MRPICDVDILNDPATQRIVAGWSLALLAGGIAAAVALALAAGFAPGGLAWWLSLALAYAVSLPLHELTHAAFFKLFGGAGTEVRFGFQTGMLYAGCPGKMFTRAQFAVILLAPFVALSLIYLVIGLVWHEPLFAWAAFALHASGCAGDFYFVRLVAAHPEADLCEDTDRGFALWANEGD